MDENRRPEGSGSRVVDPASRPRELNDLNPTTQSAADPVRMFLPGKTEAEYALRYRIDRIAVMAATSATRTTQDHARSICWIANDLANDWRTKAATEDELRNVILALTAMLGAARAVERTEPVDG
jgi:hypothetical protein